MSELILCCGEATIQDFYKYIAVRYWHLEGMKNIKNAQAGSSFELGKRRITKYLHPCCIFNIKCPTHGNRLGE